MGTLQRPTLGGDGAALIQGAVAFDRARGGTTVEAYPIEPKDASMPDAFAWTGIASAFTKLGFVEVARRSDTRPILRFTFDGPARTRGVAKSEDRYQVRHAKGAANCMRRVRGRNVRTCA